MIRTSDRRTVRLDAGVPAILANLLYRYGLEAAISDPDLCLHCRQQQCISVCPSGSLSTTAEGRTSLDSSTCCGCTACIQVCREFDNLRIEDRGQRMGVGRGRGEAGD